MKQYMKTSFLLLVFAFVFFSCEKEEGFGGLASISGKVYAKDYNSSGKLVEEGYLGDVTVYIGKKDDPHYLDRLNSSYDGSFKFKFLHPGNYDVWVFGDCDTCTWDQMHVKKSITIRGKKENAVLEDLVISI